MLDELSTPAPEASVRQRAAAAWAGTRAHPQRAVGAALAVIAVAVALWWLLRPPPPIAPEQVLPVVTAGGGITSTTVQTASSRSAQMDPSAPASTIVVHVAGAVTRPGVLRLPVGSRVVDAIEAAGGSSGDADVERINLAAIVADGAWVHVPRAGEALATPPAGAAPSGGGGASGGPTADAPLDLNAASEEQLDELPGVGPATAVAIVEHRTRNGPFTSVDSLADVPGIGPAKLERLRSLVRV